MAGSIGAGGAPSRAALALGGAALALALVAALAVAFDDRSGQPVYLAPDSAREDVVRLTREDHDLGYAPIPGTRVRARRRAGEMTLYDVTYTIDSHGLRATMGREDGPGIVFFGCSVTFGEGLGDDDTLPSAFSAATGYRFHVVNAGYMGYGPHQMLRSLETDRLAPVIAGGVDHVFYQAIRQHVTRAAGRVPWGHSGPSYEPDGDRLRYEGPFHSSLAALAIRGWDRLASTSLVKRAFGGALGRRPESERDRERWTRIVVAAAAEVRERWGAGFTVLYWDDDESDDVLIAGLEARGIEVIRVSTIIPRRQWHAVLIPIDNHPGPAATRAIADALAARFPPPS